MMEGEFIIHSEYRSGAYFIVKLTDNDGNVIITSQEALKKAKEFDETWISLLVERLTRGSPTPPMEETRTQLNQLLSGDNLQDHPKAVEIRRKTESLLRAL
jgi:hypothetical protein